MRRAMSVMFWIAVGCGERDVTEGRYQGMIELEQTDVAFEVPGRIAALDLAPGAVVHRGQRLATLDETIDRETLAVRSKELELARAELALVVAGSRNEDIRATRAQRDAASTTEAQIAREVARERTLVREAASPQSNLDALVARLAAARGERETLDQRLRQLVRGPRAEEIRRAEARVAIAEQVVELATRTLDKHALLAPIDGTVLDVYPEIGEVVAAGAPVVSLIERTRPYADVFVPIADVPQFVAGAAVELTVEGDPRTYEGVVERLAPHLEFTPRFVYSPRERPNLMSRVRIRIDDRLGRLHAGLPAYVRVGTSAREARR